MVPIRGSIQIQKNSINSGDRYRYKKTVPIHENIQILKNNTVLENSISKDFKLFTTIKKNNN